MQNKKQVLECAMLVDFFLGFWKSARMYVCIFGSETGKKQLTCAEARFVGSVAAVVDAVAVLGDGDAAQSGRGAASDLGLPTRPGRNARRCHQLGGGRQHQGGVQQRWNTHKSHLHKSFFFMELFNASEVVLKVRP